MKPTKTLIVVSPSINWPTLKEQCDAVVKFYAPIIDLQFYFKNDLKQTFAFAPYQAGSVLNATTPDWYDNYVFWLAKAFGKDGTVLIVPPEQRQGIVTPFGLSVYTGLPLAKIQLFVNETDIVSVPTYASGVLQTERKELGRSVTVWLEHEIAHWLCALYNVKDRTHEFFGADPAFTTTADPERILMYLKPAIEASVTAIEEHSFWQRIGDIIVAAVQSIRQPSTPASLPTCSACETVPSMPKKDLLDALCLKIREHEGWYPGSRSMRNKNPGNCRFSSVGYLPKYGVVREDREGVDEDQQGYAIFSDHHTGYMYLTNLARQKIQDHPNWTLYDFFGDPKEGWAPDKDHNNSRHYAEVVASGIGVSASAPIKNLL